MLGTATIRNGGSSRGQPKGWQPFIGNRYRKFFTIDKTTQIPSGSTSASGGFVNINYNQKIAKYTNSGMRISGSYVDGINTVATTNSTTDYLILITPSANAYESIVQMDFYANGITGVDYSVSASTERLGRTFMLAFTTPMERKRCHLQKSITPPAELLLPPMPVPTLLESISMAMRSPRSPALLFITIARLPDCR
jgi:hypothetical protein